jgi:hypothetical protein
LSSTREVFVIVEEPAVRLCQGDFNQIKGRPYRIGITVEDGDDHDKIGAVFMYQPEGGKKAFGKDLLRASLGEEAWGVLLDAIGAAP